MFRKLCPFVCSRVVQERGSEANVRFSKRSRSAPKLRTTDSNKREKKWWLEAQLLEVNSPRHLSSVSLFKGNCDPLSQDIFRSKGLDACTTL